MSDDQFDRVPPQDIDAEMSVLGSMMLTTEAANVVSEMLRGRAERPRRTRGRDHGRR